MVRSRRTLKFSVCRLLNWITPQPSIKERRPLIKALATILSLTCRASTVPSSPLVMAAALPSPSDFVAPSTSTSTYDLTGHTICTTCKSRYIEPTDLYVKGPKKGTQRVKCKMCRNEVSSKDFPAHLRVPKDTRTVRAKKFPAHLRVPKDTRTVRAKDSTTPTIEEQWIASLNLEQESVLIHSAKVLKTYVRLGIQVSDLPRATSQIQWDDIVERLRDIYSLHRLFQNFDALQRFYSTEQTTVAPIGLLAVSLNNCAVRSSLPCKLV